jgi:hypothetical protein
VIAGGRDVPPLLLTLLRFVLAAFPAILFVPDRKRHCGSFGYGLPASRRSSLSCSAVWRRIIARVARDPVGFFTIGWSFANAGAAPSQLLGAVVSAPAWCWSRCSPRNCARLSLVIAAALLGPPTSSLNEFTAIRRRPLGRCAATIPASRLS